MKYFVIDFDTLARDSFLRNDEKYHVFLHHSDWDLFNVKSKEVIRLKDILVEDYNNFEYIEGEEYRGIPTGRSYLDEDGEITDFQAVNLENHPGRLKYKASNDNLLISSVRLARSPALFFENDNLSEYVFSNGFYIFKVNSEWNRRFILYVLRTKKLKDIINHHLYRGIGISAYKDDDLLKIKIPIIPRSIQDKIVHSIEPIEKRIKELKTFMKKPQEIINEIFATEFNFDIQKVYAVEQMKEFIISNTTAYRNFNLRSSVRWHKIAPIQEVMYKDNPHINKLGNYIISTKHGWSPTCKETDSLNYVFGLNSISANSVINYDDLKLSNETREDIKSFYVKEGDLFVSRGNTVDLVALASVVENIQDEKEIVFPDLFIKLDLNEDELDKKYLSYLFNSIIGRLYFKYAAKGKNQTMVKISEDELNNFYLPVPPLQKQKKIVDKIKLELSKREETQQRIDFERNKINEIIEGAIVGI